MRQYTGIPYKVLGRDRSGIDCWGLISLVYRECWDVQLPDFGPYGISGDHVQFHEVEKPRNMDLVRVDRAPGADHWGLYFGGMVLQACQPSSCFITLRRFLQHHPKTSFYSVVH